MSASRWVARALWVVLLVALLFGHIYGEGPVFAAARLVLACALTLGMFALARPPTQGVVLALTVWGGLGLIASWVAPTRVGFQLIEAPFFVGMWLAALVDRVRGKRAAQRQAQP